MPADFFDSLDFVGSGTLSWTAGFLDAWAPLLAVFIGVAIGVLVTRRMNRVASQDQGEVNSAPVASSLGSAWTSVDRERLSG